MNGQLANSIPRSRLRITTLTVVQLLIIVILFLVVISLVRPTEVRAAARPNFVFFLADDQPYLSLGCTGNTVLTTPAMDRLAAEGVLFERAFVTTAICCCSRASFLTGQHMRRHGIQDFAKPLSAAQLQQTFPVLLRLAGYRTAFLGKYAIGSPRVDQRLALPADQFDLWYGFPQNIAFKQTENGKDRYLTTVMTEKAVQFLKTTQSDQPFCLIMALKEPHGPLDYFDPEFPKPYTDATIPLPKNLTRASFEALPELVRTSLAASPRWLDAPESFQAHVRQRYSYISRADLAVRQIREALASQGLQENTVVVFTSDNGDMAGAHALTGKWIMHEESIHVPLIISDPRMPASTRGRRTQMALNIDLAPTILAIAGVPIPPAMQGENLQPLLLDSNARTRDDWYYEHVYSPDDGRRSIPKIEGVRSERWKYTRYTEPNPPLEQLFDLAADPLEEKDLAQSPAHSETLSHLRARCDEYRTTLK
jgi:arylsulfatase A-like enzyme